MKKKPAIKKMVCPRCAMYWARLDIRDYPTIEAHHVSIVHGPVSELKNGDSLKCSECAYEYTTVDVTLAAAEPGNYGDLQPGQKLIAKTARPKKEAHAATSDEEAIQ